MKNRRFLTLLSILVLVMAVGAVALAGCGDEEPAATTAAPTETTAAPTETTGAPTETTAAPTETTAAPTGETIKLKYADQNAPTSWPGIHAATPWLDSIEQATNGQVKIERFFGQTLMTGADTWEGLKAGVSDLAWCMFQYWAGLAPLSEVMTLPFLPFDKGELGAAVLWQLYEEFPSIQAEFKDNHLISMWTSSPFYLLTTKKPVYKPEDMKGLKIRALGGPPTQLVEALGGTPVSMIMPDTYQALQTGVLDGILTNWESLYSFRHYEVGKYVTLVPFHAGIFGVAANNNSWEKLPDNVKQVFNEKGGMEGARFWGREKFDKCAEEVEAMIADGKIDLEFITPTPEEIETLWKQPYGEPLWEEWVKKMEAEGKTDARAILNRALELLEAGLPQ